MDPTNNNTQDSTTTMDIFKQYGKIGIITHLSLSWSFLLATYLFIQRTGKSAVLIKKLKLQNKIPPKAGSFAIAGVIYKAVMPFRLAASLLILPIVVKTFSQESQPQQISTSVTE